MSAKHLDSILQRVQSENAVAKKLARLGEELIRFEHVTPSAYPLLLSAIAQYARRRVWILAGTVREQDRWSEEIAIWHPDALFLPENQVAAGDQALPDPETVAERLAILHRLIEAPPKDYPEIILVPRHTLDDAVPSRKTLSSGTSQIRKGQRIERDTVIELLEKSGYERAPQVALRGQFAVRGGILDIFAWHHRLPFRVEWFDIEIESIRQFDPDSQISIQPREACTILTAEPETLDATLRDYINPGDIVISTAEDPSATVLLTESASTEGEEDFSCAFHEHGLGEFDAGDLIVAESRRHQLFQQIEAWRRDGWTLFLFCNNEGEAERLHEVLQAVHLEEYPTFVTGSLGNGFTFPAGRFAVLCDAELFGRYRQSTGRRIARQLARDGQRAQIDFTELVEGEYVVHLEHGIALFHGLAKAPGVSGQESLVLEFADEARLYVPLDQAFLVSRYVGVGKKHPALHTLGDGAWGRAKEKATKAAFDYAARLLSIHAERETAKGFAFPEDTKWQHEFEASFVFETTPDQARAIDESKADMESERPMDRLICGDVGFGKTEVAIRTAFKAVMSGKQVAILAPTTVLAQQHYHTFRERMSDYPVKVEMLSRFRTPSEQRSTIAGLIEGRVDIVIGTHRLVSGDVLFKDLGLVVIDEEQRFGVRHKERFKEMFKLIDVLTLSATPIPRTLYLSLMGARDMSLIETPPRNRIPVETVICGYDERIIRDAITRELSRQGQIYFLHNRVQTIEKTAARIADLCPKARVAIGHGQMDEDELEEIMDRFVKGDSDVLVSTTIIESGLDIPNANTIIIDRADRFGLADLYQLRGRVGRSNHKAYAYLMLPRDMMTVGAARKRINAIKQYGSLGAGFKIAMRDLEIRGAGNILGTAQSGHIIAIGFDLYCQLLKQAVAKMKGERLSPRADLPVSLDFVTTQESAVAESGKALSTLPVDYLSDAPTRIHAFRAVAEVSDTAQIEKLRKQWRDRFGPLPQAADNLLTIAAIRIAASHKRLRRLEVRDHKVMLTRGGDFILIGGKFPRVSHADPNARLTELLALIESL